jgi:hypothetical protein
MINYTERITRLMQDIVSRIPALSLIDMSRVLVFARFGRPNAEGAFATCHSLNLPTSEPGYFFWRDRGTGHLTRRSEWFVTKSPEVRLGGQNIDYLISFVLPRFCNQTLERSRKRDHYPGADGWIAKLDTVVHELYHIDPHEGGIRRLERADGSYSPRSHGPSFYEEVAAMVRQYLDSNPPRELYEFLELDFRQLEEHYKAVVGTTFRNFPSFPQRYREVLATQPSGPVAPVQQLKGPAQPALYTDRDVVIHRFQEGGARRVQDPRRFQAA